MYSLSQRFVLLCMGTATVVILTGCAERSGFLIRDYAYPNPLPEGFYVCHGYGCSTKTGIKLGDQDWSNIQEIFKTKTQTAKEERQKIAKAIALFENKVGEVLGTHQDKPKSPVLFYDATQQDCIDETINTTTYLTLLKKAGLLKWHTVGVPARRGYIVDGRWPHNTAVIVEHKTGNEFAVDSWFYKNGENPAIIPLALWRSGWEAPPNAKPSS